MTTHRIDYKPALLAERRFLELSATHLICRDASGAELWRLALADVSGLAFVEHRLRGALLSRLDFELEGERAKRSLSRTSDALRASSDPEYRAYRAAISAIIERLALIRPDLPVTVGEYGRSRWWLFAIGLISLLGALGIALGAALGGRGAVLVGEAMVPVGLLLVFGLALGWAYAPWRRPPRVPVKALASAIDRP